MQIVEPEFGQIKQARGFRQFLLRGIDKVSSEWALLCTVHNILKLAKAARAPPNPLFTGPQGLVNDGQAGYPDRLLAAQ